MMTPSKHKHASPVRFFVLTVMALVFGGLISGQTVRGGERQFLVILANSPKQFPDPEAPPTLINPQLINEQYFDTDDPNVQSFAEYWREISYGDVTIRGETSDWINLPWRITPDPLVPRGPVITPLVYGLTESFNNSVAQVSIDINDDGIPDDIDLDLDGTPDGVLDLDGDGIDDATPGGLDTFRFSSGAVWMPGERFQDMDGDGLWDALDEARNQMDFVARCSGDADCAAFGPEIRCFVERAFRGVCMHRLTGSMPADGRPDLLGPWVDLNEDEEPVNPQDCIYLPDSDNDGSPDCCPDGPGTPGCEGLLGEGVPCPPTTWEGPESEIEDCNGNLVPDVCDISCTSPACRDTGWLDEHPGVCGTSSDALPITSSTEACDVPNPDGIPDECQFTNFDPAGTSDGCVESDLDENDPCAGRAECDIIDPPLNDTDVMLPRCEFHDFDEDGQLDIVEPFENFLRFAGGGRVPNDYIEHNYPGHPEKVIAQQNTKTIWGQHDPFGNLSTCTCTDGTPCETSPAGDRDACSAGVHAVYNPPDRWSDRAIDFGNQNVVRTTKMSVADALAFRTPEPDWYQQAWVDRYGTQPPPWDSRTTVVAAPLDETSQRRFLANFGGLNGAGRGWVGDQVDRPRIMPEETRRIGTDADDQPLMIYDGYVEHDDLPSSKYHHAGDDWLGEVTSPFNTDIWGHDRGDHRPETNVQADGIIVAAGPYAVSVHGNFGRDAGNVLQMEVLSWRTQPPSNTGAAWFSDIESLRRPQRSRSHPYARVFGFRDYNLDGLIDQGWVRAPGSENYVADFNPFTSNNGHSGTEYPWNRRRLLEDTIAIIDDVFDLDDFVDRVARDAVECVDDFLLAGTVPESLAAGQPFPFVLASGILSGIVVLPPGADEGALAHISPDFYPIHVEDGLGDAEFLDANLPRAPRVTVGQCNESGSACDNDDDCLADQFCGPAFQRRVSWHLFVHDLVQVLDDEDVDGAIETGGALTTFAAEMYLASWEGFPDLEDYDADDEGALENCPIGAWDIMASDDGLIHPSPVLKEQPCTQWIRPVDLTTVVSPGVDKVLTLPPSEVVRDDSHYFLENANRIGERYYLWSAGLQGLFGPFLPGDGMLIQHTDIQFCQDQGDCEPGELCRNGLCRGSASNPDAPPAHQRSPDRPAFLIVQADGDDELQACTTGGNRGDDGDPWPGNTGATRFDGQGTTRASGRTNTPSATWYTLNSPTGLEILDIVPDGTGSVQLTVNWIPTSIPSLRFRQPPGGVSVGSSYQVRYDATDVYGGTTVRLFYRTDEKKCSGSNAVCLQNSDCPAGQRCRYEIKFSGQDAATFVGQVRKTTPGTSTLSQNWNIRPGGVPIADGRYVFFAKLIPGQGADGTEAKRTTPRAGRNNIGNGTLTVDLVSIDTDADDADDKARLETWTAVCIDNGQTWRVNGTITQPILNPENPNSDPWPKARTCTQQEQTQDPTCANRRYSSVGGEVSFTIRAGSVPFQEGDTFSFTTTGITAVSRAVTISAGRITEDPVAIIRASPLAGDPPLTVNFDARDSVDPNGEPLEFRWTFGDGTAPATGPQVEHTFNQAGTFSVVLRATNPRNQRFGESAVDIRVTNNTPKAVIDATPTSGPPPLEVQFGADGSSDLETPSDRLIYHWDFGDGGTANNAREPGPLFEGVTHTYNTRGDGTACTADTPCTFTATLTVIDEGEREDTATINILVGNTHPVANVSVNPTQGPAPLVVEFNAIGSSDADGDDLKVIWNFDNPHATASNPNVVELPPEGTDETGRVRHTYTQPGTYTPTARVIDLKADGSAKGGEARWPGATITVTGNLPPDAAFDVRPATGVVGQSITFDATASTDPDSEIVSYVWDFGDESPAGSGEIVQHTYAQAQPAGYLVRLTVTDDRGATDSVTRRVVIVAAPENRGPVAHIATGPRGGPVPFTRTFDGRTSFDPDGDVLTFTWTLGTAGQPDETISTSSVVTRRFDMAGTYTVTLTVEDEHDATDQDQVEIRVTPAGTVPPPPPPPPPDGGGQGQEPPDSANQRPSPLGMCGLGMLPGFLATLFGLTAAWIVRRRIR